MRRASMLLASLSPIAAAILCAPPAEACAPAPPPGAFVQIAEESAIIVWDDKAHVEHFIRRAAFRTDARDFGFLVPTPQKPELAEMDNTVFDRLEQATKPKIVHETKLSGVEPTALCAFLFSARSAMAPMTAAVAPAVRVLDAKRVAGYDAVVLEADDAGALAGWLKDHGYADRPALASFLAPYVALHWKITAFKIARGEGPEPAVATSAVRMTFPADKPFFPYREPSDQRENMPASLPEADRDRLLRVFFFGPARVDGALGDGAGPNACKTIWSNHLDPADTAPLPAPIPAGAWLTVFEDTSSPRPGTADLFFSPAADPKPVIPPPVVYTTYSRVPIPIDLLAAAAIGGWIYRRRRHDKIAAPPPP